MGTNEQQQESKYKRKELIKSGGWLNEFLWICAGVDRKVLRQCPTDYAKYAVIGGTILFSALMAMLSRGYAMSLVFSDSILALILGTICGALVLFLNRFFIKTLKTDGKVTISWREFKTGLPRIIIAIVIGIILATPLQMKVFEERINLQMINDRISEDNQEIEHRFGVNGFCVRYNAFLEVKSERKDINTVSVLIMLLFIIIETAPIIFKMIMTSSPYDDLLRTKILCESKESREI